MEGSPQYTVLKAHRTDLKRHTELSLRAFAGPLCDKNVLNDDLYKDIMSCIDRHNGREGAEKLVDCVLLSIEADPEISKTFLDVLKSKGNKGLQTFVKKLEQEIKNSEGLQEGSLAMCVTFKSTEESSHELTLVHIPMRLSPPPGLGLTLYSPELQIWEL